MGRRFRKGENVVDARAKWKLEKKNEQQRIRREEQQREEQQREIELKKYMELRERTERKIEKLMSRKAEPVIMPPPIPYIPGDKKLSILISSIKGRERLLQDLIDELNRQSTDDVEILVEMDDKEITIGEKRNILLERARGNYVAFVDDDDEVSKDYIVKILEAIKSEPDCCSLKGHLIRKANRRTLQRAKQGRGQIEEGGIYTNIFIHSLKYKTWFEENGVYYRCPNHLNAVRRELALQVGFPDINKGEDVAYSFKLLLLLKIEAFIEGTIYFYRKNR